MNITEKNMMLEDRIMTLLMNNPKLLLKKPFDIGIFNKWVRVVATMLTQLNSGINPDISTLQTALPNDEEAIEELSELVWDSRASADNYEEYLRQLEEGVMEFRIYKELHKSFNSISRENPPSSVVNRIAMLKTDMAIGTGKKYSYNTVELIENFNTRLAEIEANKHRYKLSSGIAILDRHYQGFHPGNLIVVGARPGVGKTAIGTTIASNMARQGYKIGFISTEMSNDQVTARFLSLSSGLPCSSLMSGNITEWGRLEKASKEVQSWDVYVCDKTAMKVSDIAMQIRAWQVLDGIDLVIIDYLTRLQPEKEKNSKVVEVGDIVTGIKNIARETKIPVMLLAQLNRAAALRAGKVPSMADLRDSGVIEQEADSVLLLSRATKDDENAKTGIIIDKNRHGQAGVMLAVDFDAQTMRWY